jgi:Na+-driven multidrug efflux pump
VFAILLVKDVAILHVFGDRYVLCSNVVTLLLPGIVAQSLTLLMMGDFLGKRRLSVVLYSALLCFVTMVALDLVVIRHWGILGAAAVSSIAYACQTAVLVSDHARTNGQQLSNYLLMKRNDVDLMLRRLRLGRGRVAA